MKDPIYIYGNKGLSPVDLFGKYVPNANGTGMEWQDGLVGKAEAEGRDIIIVGWKFLSRGVQAAFSATGYIDRVMVLRATQPEVNMALSDSEGE